MIKFGTDGWRGIIGEDYTVENVCLVTQAISVYIKKQKLAKPVVVGYDARFMSERFAQWVARVLAANGLSVLLADRMAPTPAISWAAKLLNSAGAIMVTASHNPPEYNGIKFKAPFGGPASPEIMGEIELCLQDFKTTGKLLPLVDFSRAIAEEKIIYFDPVALHEQQIRSVIDFSVVEKVHGSVVFDAMHGSAMGYMKKLVGENMRFTEIRAEENPGFGGVNPEPIPQNLEPLRDRVQKEGAVVGLATDGDGDRIGAIDADGTYINANQIMAILTKYLVEKRGWSGDIARSCTVSDLVDKVAQKYNLTTHVTPVGFKYICDLMLTRDILIGGEESGGIGIKNYIPERDGVLLALLLLEAIAVYGKTLGGILQEMMNELGYFYSKRIDTHVAQEKKMQLMEYLHAGHVREIAGTKVVTTNCLDGVKLITEDGWIMFRPSGTEPLVRIYAEAGTLKRLEELQEFGKQMLV